MTEVKLGFLNDFWTRDNSFVRSIKKFLTIDGTAKYKEI